mmetsp:Transcript_4983/g.17995  ORF Transcript_4983/g.17995 Transcript_4983/m.17995 type:complete len:520 (-) Transcript_4983:283-1842(-)
MAGGKLLIPLSVFAACCVLLSSTLLYGGEKDSFNNDDVALAENADLCATQAVKLDDCLPKARPPPKHYTTYRVGNKLVPWKTVKTAVKTDPRGVLQSVQQQTQQTRNRLNSLQAKEVMQEDFIQQTERRLEEAKQQMSRLVSSLHPPPQTGAAQTRTESRGKAGGGTGGAVGAAAAGGGKGASSLVLETALATSLAAEQNEIASLKRRLKLLARARRAGRRHRKQTATAMSNSSAVSLRNLTAATSSLSNLLGSAEKKWMSVKKGEKDPREEEDDKLEKQAQERMKWQEAALVQEEKDEQRRIKQMNSWSSQLLHGGLNRIGFNEYGVGKAMKRMRRKTEERTMPQKMQVSARKEARQLRKAGVSESDILGTFHLYDSPSSSSPKHVHLARHVHLIHLLGKKKSRSQSSPDVSDLKAMQKVGKISEATEAKANEAVQSIIDGKDKHGASAVSSSSSSPASSRRIKPSPPLKIDVYPGSLRPLRTKVNPTSIRFWKQLDNSGVHFHQDRGREGDPIHLLQ